jgi:hypothetical protein
MIAFMQQVVIPKGNTICIVRYQEEKSDPKAAV